MPEEQGGYIKYSEGDKKHFREGSNMFEALRKGYQVTRDNYGFVVDVWDPVTKTIRDIGTLLPVGNRESTYTMPEAIKPLDEMTLEELQDAMSHQKGDIKVEKNAIRYMYQSMSWKNSRMRKIGREIQKRTQPQKGGYRRRWYHPRPLRYYVTGRTYLPYSYVTGASGSIS